MNEAQRLHYLDALGIEQFVPTRVLPNSAGLRVCELPILAAEIKTQEKSVGDQEKEAQETRALPRAANALHHLVEQPDKNPSEKPQLAKGILEELESQLSSGKRFVEHSTAVEGQTDEALISQERDVEKVASTTDEAHFHLAIWYLEDGLLIVDSHEPRSALPTETLLVNMLLSKKLLSLQLPRVNPLSWPLPSSSERGWDAARDYVASFVEAATQHKPPVACILMGEVALQAFGGQANEYERFKLFNDATPALYLPSLVQILRNPNFKAQVWKELNLLFSN